MTAPLNLPPLRPNVAQRAAVVARVREVARALEAVLAPGAERAQQPTVRIKRQQTTAPLPLLLVEVGADAEVGLLRMAGR